MTRTLTAMVTPVGITYCTTDGTPYRADYTGIVHVLSTHVAQITAKGGSTATATSVSGTIHNGCSLSISKDD